MGALGAAIIVSVAQCHPSILSVVVVSIVRGVGTTGLSGWGMTWWTGRGHQWGWTDVRVSIIKAPPPTPPPLASSSCRERSTWGRQGSRRWVVSGVHLVWRRRPLTESSLVSLSHREERGAWCMHACWPLPSRPPTVRAPCSPSSHWGRGSRGGRGVHRRHGRHASGGCATWPARTLDLEIAATDGVGSAPGPRCRGVLGHMDWDGHAACL